MKRTRDDDPSHFLYQYDEEEEDEEEEDSSSGGFQPEPPSPPPQQVKHFCVICSKQFSSGKAYGGHVRIHSSEYSSKGKTKKMKTKKKRKIGLVNNKEKEKEKEIDLIRADVEGKIRCCLCGKEFQTMHSLFGHMRRHPDRSWKGVRPPLPEKLNLSFLDDDDDDEDDENDEDYEEVMSGVTKDVRDAACCLMMLKAGKRKAAMETANSEVRSFSYCNDDKGEIYDEMDVDMKIKMENEVINLNNPQDDPKKRSLGFDLNQPCHD